MQDHEEDLQPEDEFEARIRELEENATRIRKHHQAASEIGESFESRLSDLEGQASKAKQSYEAKKAEARRETIRQGEGSRGLGLGLSAAYMIVGVPLGFGFVGWLIDRSTGGKLWIGILTLIGAVIGITMVVLTINRANPDK